MQSGGDEKLFPSTTRRALWPRAATSRGGTMVEDNQFRADPIDQAPPGVDHDRKLCGVPKTYVVQMSAKVLAARITFRGASAL